MHNDAEGLEIECVNKVQDNINACVADPNSSVETMSSSEQTSEKAIPGELAPRMSEPCDPSTKLWDYPEGGTESSDMQGMSRFWETEQGGGQIQDVQGQLKKNLVAPRPVIECIEGSYKLPLLSVPPPFCKPNHSLALINTDFVDCSIKVLLDNRCIYSVNKRPHVCSPLSVVSNREGKKRLVLNLRHLNNFLLKEKFKYEDIRVAISLFKKGDYVFTFDLKSGYHHVDIHRELWQYLGFAWGWDLR